MNDFQTEFAVTAAVRRCSDRNGESLRLDRDFRLTAYDGCIDMSLLDGRQNAAISNDTISRDGESGSPGRPPGPSQFNIRICKRHHLSCPGALRVRLAMRYPTTKFPMSQLVMIPVGQFPDGRLTIQQVPASSAERKTWRIVFRRNRGGCNRFRPEPLLAW